MIRNSYQSAKSVHTGGTEPTIEEENPTPAPLRPTSLTPSAKQASQWLPPPQQPQHGDFGLMTTEPHSVDHSPNHSTMTVDQQLRPAYDRHTSGEYPGLANDAPTPTPQKDTESAYFGGRPRQRASALSQDNTSMRGTLPRYAPLGNGNTPRRPQSILSTRQNPWEVYDPDDRPLSNQGSSGTPSKTKPNRRGTSFYIVRENGSDAGPPDELLRLPFTHWIQGSLRNHFVAFLGEFIGTTMFLWLAFAGTIVANVGAKKSADSTTTNATVGFSPIVNLYVAISFGFSLLVNVWIFFRVSGGLFNPAVTLGMVMTKTINYIRGFLLFAAQITGAIFASFLVQVMFPTDFNVRTTLADDTSVTQGVFIEMVLTAQLVFTVFMLAKEKHKATHLAPIGIGMCLFIAEIVGVFFTGGSLNPARSFGPCVVAGKFDAEHWIYWVGPCCGTLVAYAFYRFIKILEYEMANPGQDHSAEEAEAARSMKRAESFV
ncbi:hypothetical protein M409DRAFT_70101 [Zasmidium cellare ATCC 36951]|uniref:Aquaporin n=1 Tax=Zasmidium cellare ATCC 36951 TaxID=1080233 RepID=A0A6A6C233_ZASCE|nr:uncharacterized protein M409DRAFT_70101 [Zasmidium cellare ATCC 36951]KAF2161035.1 hypothetical protein M409DRAFT_70101 [Zasmidium cellare ATCC 36951]